MLFTSFAERSVWWVRHKAPESFDASNNVIDVLYIDKKPRFVRVEWH